MILKPFSFRILLSILWLIDFIGIPGVENINESFPLFLANFHELYEDFVMLPIVYAKTKSYDVIFLYVFLRNSHTFLR